MISSQITMADLCRVTGYTRHQVRGLLAMALPEGSGKGARFAREFRKQDLICVAALTELETRFGVKRDYVSRVAKRLAQVLSGPKLQSRDAWLIVSFDPPKVVYTADDAPAIDGVVMSLGPLFERVDRYVRATAAGSTQELQLGPTVLRATTGKRST